ncbi:2-C-methyl-D-erythritol 4-phosphate cytidylyltransferase [Candidatus Acetothermia bacterium]|nr:2-C-methyl-D-erythritol 4-phosphate cytidylyltransferase [Candidatus Acetothermia bacterium]
MGPVGVSAVILAAGQGQRMGTEINKPYLLLHGLPIVYYSLARFGGSLLIDEIVVVVRESEVTHVQERVLEKHAFDKSIKVVGGGLERQDSVYEGVCATKSEYILVHDGVRPFFSSVLLSRLIEAVKTYDAVIPVLRSSDTLSQVNQEGLIERELDRHQIVRAQTPQAFRYGLIRESLEKVQRDGKKFTDEAGAVLAMSGVHPKIIEGEEWNIKITTPWDLQLAECLGRILLV